MSLFFAIGLMASLTTGSLIAAAAPPPTAEDVRELMERQPLTSETWPAWRDYYLRLYYAYEVGEPREFYERLGSFLAEVAARNEGTLPGEWASDPIAWIVLTNHFERSGPEFLARAEQASRIAVALGDPSGMSSFELAGTLILSVRQGTKAGELTPESRQKLVEAEERLRLVEQAAPEARLSYWRGMIAWFRNEKAAAIPLLRQGVLDHPKQSSYAANYLAMWLFSELATKPFAETTEPFLKQFPNDANIQAIHAVALYRDERFFEAYEVLHKARQQDEKAVKFLGPEGIKTIAEGRWLTPLVREGLKLEEKKLHRDAAQKLREALQNDPENLFAARMLTRSLMADADARRLTRDTVEIRKIIDECGALCRQFPKDAELQVAHAGALFRGGRSIEASEALDRAQSLGGNIDKLAGPGGEKTVREAARRETHERNLWLVLIGVVGLYAAWIASMFLIGAFLATMTSRSPDPLAVAEEGLSSRELWLQRLYLVVLSLGLVLFYVSVPIVSLGLLAITVGLFLLMLALRFIHFGFLQRGLFATWGVIRSAIVGPRDDTVGIEVSEEQHPRLFAALEEVAARLDTRSVDSVFLTPTSQIAVREEGRGPFGLFRRRRVMKVGMPTFSLLTVTEFKSVLAHEYGHFSHQDTFYSRFIFQVSISLAHSLAVMNAAGGVMTYVNPFHGFYWLYLKAYGLVASGFSRSREFLADRRAVLAYGKVAFQTSFTKISVDGLLFEATSVRSVRDELSAGRAFVNLFDAFRHFQDQPDTQELHRQILESVRETKPGWYDSHPTFSERLAAVEYLPISHEPAETIPATQLLSDISQIEVQLTGMLTEYVHQMRDNHEMPDF